MRKQYWKVQEVAKDTRSRYYVTGINYAQGEDKPEAFGWHLDSLDDPRYDLSEAKIDPKLLDGLRKQHPEL